MGGSRSQSVIALRGVTGSALFSPGQIEALKWAALGAMLIGHVNRYVLNFSQDWAFAVGRQAFPLFALALGAALLSPGARDGAPGRAAFRLFPFALAAQAGVLLVGGGPHLNILFLYMAACAWVSVELNDARDAGPYLVVRVLALVVAFLSEFSLPGFVFIVALWRWIQWRGDAALFIAAGLFLLVSWLEGSFWGFSAVGTAAVVWLWRLEWPRWRRLFAWAYVGQFAVLAAVRGLYG